MGAPGVEMYFLLKKGDIPAGHVSLPEGNSFLFLKMLIIQVDVSKNKGTPKWMVKIMENPIKMDGLGCKKTYFWFNTQVERW